MKFRNLLVSLCIIALSVTGAFADSDNDATYSKLAEQLTSLVSLQRSLNANNAKIQKVSDRLGALQALEANEKNQRKKKKVEARTAALNKKTEAIEQEIAAKNQEIESLKAQLQNDEDVRSWHKRAKAQIISWNFRKKDRQVVLTILDKRTGKTSAKTAKFRTRGEDKFYLINNLPDGLQAVVPEGYTVNLDSRAGFAAKIEDPGNITGSALDDESNKDENNGKTFTAGEGFIILRQSSMTIRPPEESESESLQLEESDSNSESESQSQMIMQTPTQTQTQIDPEYLEMSEPQQTF